MTDMIAPPSVPDVAAVIRFRDRLAQRVLWAFQGSRLTAESLQPLGAAVHKAAPGISADVISASLIHLAGQILTPAMLREIAWRFAGNRQRLEAGAVVQPWRQQVDCEWAPVQILSCLPRRSSRKHTYGADFRMRILAGTACPLIIVKWWSSRFCRGLGLRAGYTWQRSRYPFQDQSELVNLRFVVELDPAYSRGQPGFEHIGCTPSLRRWNRKIIQYRFRKDGRRDWPCPRDYSHACFLCHVGYVDCPAATHERTVPIDE